MLTQNEAYVFYRNLVDIYEMVGDFNAQNRKTKKRRRQERPKSQDISSSSGTRVRTSSDGELEMTLNSSEAQPGPAMPPVALSPTGADMSTSMFVSTSRELKNSNVKYQVPAKYAKFMHDGDPDEYDAMLKLLNKVHAELEKIEAAGSHFGRILRDRKDIRFALIKGFLANLDVWGSQPPAMIESSQRPLPTLAEARVRSYVYYHYMRGCVDQGQDPADQP